jgi:monoamine oxidase
MFKEEIETLIVGAGLSGIYAAHLLHQRKKSFAVLEARSRIGGRILCPEYEGFFADLGPSWYWPSIHPRMADLIQSLELHGYRQYEEGMGCYQLSSGSVRTTHGYVMQPLSWRLSGGMAALIRKLCAGIPESAIRLNHPVCHIEKTAAGVRVHVGELEREPWAQFTAESLILAIPPRLAAASILFTPDLSSRLTQAMLGTGTWMAGQAKFYAFYEKPFWRHSGLSGLAFSECGPLTEIHDGCNRSQHPYGLTGFIGVPARQRRQQELLTEAIFQQLAAIYGEDAARPAQFFYQDWAREPFTATEYDQPPMYEHPLYSPPAGQCSIWDGAVRFAGTETAEEHGGYLEGALGSAERAVTG